MKIKRPIEKLSLIRIDKRLDISIGSINLKEKFKDIHHIEIAGISSLDKEYVSILNIWFTEGYNSLPQ